jgi:hypothetical protein
MVGTGGGVGSALWLPLFAIVGGTVGGTGRAWCVAAGVTTGGVSG